VVLTSTSTGSAAVEHCFIDDSGKDGPRERCFAASTGTLIPTNSAPEPSIIPLLVIGLGMAGFGYLGIGYEHPKRRRARTA